MRLVGRHLADRNPGCMLGRCRCRASIFGDWPHTAFSLHEMALSMTPAAFRGICRELDEIGPLEDAKQETEGDLGAAASSPISN